MRTRQAIVSQNQRNFLNHFFFCDFRLWPQRISDSAEGVDEAQAMFFSIFFPHGFGVGPQCVSDSAGA